MVRPASKTTIGVAAALCLVLAGCSSNGSSGAKAGSGSGGAPPDIAHSTAQLQQYGGVSTWNEPGPKFDASGAKGKTVWYIPSDYSVPIFHTISSNMQTALEKAGASLTVCDGKGNPTQFNACFNNAVAQNAGVVIFDSLYSETIAGGIAAANAKKIPVIMGNDQDPTAPLPKGVDAQVSFEYSLSGRLVSDWIIKDSGGAADVLLTNTTDNPNSSAVLDKGYAAELTKYCSSCKFTTKALSISQWATDLPSITSSALTANPNINYVVPEYDGMTAFMGPAIKQLGKANSVKVATFNADLAQMQMMANGDLVYVNVGGNNAYEGWAYADQSLRLMTGTKPVANENVPVRVFTRDNVKSLKLTTAAADSGEWYGTADYRSEYQKLWGIGG